MGRGEQRAKERFAAHNKQKAKTKLLIIALVLSTILIIGLYVIQATKTYDYTQRTDERPFKGKTDATVVFLEYSDIQCPACGAAQPLITRLQEEYGDRVRFEFRHFPLQNIHPFAYDAALAAECAQDMGAFWECVDLAFANQDALGHKDLIRYAGVVGLEEESFEACLKSEAKEQQVRSDIADGNKNGVQGTPTFFINGRQVKAYTYDALSQALQSELS